MRDLASDDEIVLSSDFLEPKSGFATKTTNAHDQVPSTPEDQLMECAFAVAARQRNPVCLLVSFAFFAHPLMILLIAAQLLACIFCPKIFAALMKFLAIWCPPVYNCWRGIRTSCLWKHASFDLEKPDFLNPKFSRFCRKLSLINDRYAKELRKLIPEAQDLTDCASSPVDLCFSYAVDATFFKIDRIRVQMSPVDPEDRTCLGRERPKLHQYDHALLRYARFVVERKMMLDDTPMDALNWMSERPLEIMNLRLSRFYVTSRDPAVMLDDRHVGDDRWNYVILGKQCPESELTRVLERGVERNDPEETLEETLDETLEEVLQVVPASSKTPHRCQHLVCPTPTTCKDLADEE